MTRATATHTSLLTGCLAVTLAVGLAACGSATGSAGASAGSVAPAASSSSTALASNVPVSAGGSDDRNGASGATSPGPTPAATPRADAAKPFLSILTSDTFAARAAISGELTLGPTAYPIAGTFEVHGADNRQALTVSIPGAMQTSESVRVGGVSYVRRGGLWFETPAAGAGAGSGDLASAFRTMLDVTDTGSELKDGRELHHLVPRSGTSIPLSAIGTKDPAGDGVVSIEFYVEDDGTPVVMVIDATWTQVDGTTRQPASMTIEYRFSDVGSSIAIGAPEQVWSTFTSKRFGYTMAYPADWDAQQSPKKGEDDSFYSAVDTGVFVNRLPTGGHSLNAITAAYAKHIRSTGSKASVTSNKAATVDGSKARRLEWTAIYKGTRSWNIEVLVVRGKNVYFVLYESMATLTPADRATFDAYLSTLDLPGASAATSSAPGQVS